MNRALYPKRTALPSLLLSALLLAACEAPAPTPAPSEAASAEAWPNEHEVLFQEAEALKYTLEQYRLETQRLQDADLPTNPPAPLQ